MNLGLFPMRPGRTFASLASRETPLYIDLPAHHVDIVLRSERPALTEAATVDAIHGAHRFRRTVDVSETRIQLTEQLDIQEEPSSPRGIQISVPGRAASTALNGSRSSDQPQSVSDDVCSTRGDLPVPECLRAKMTCLVISHPKMQDHVPSEIHPESPARLAAIEDALAARPELAYRSATPAAPADIELIHPPEYIEALETLRDVEGEDADTATSPGSIEASWLLQEPRSKP